MSTSLEDYVKSLESRIHRLERCFHSTLEEYEHNMKNSSGIVCRIESLTLYSIEGLDGRPFSLELDFKSIYGGTYGHAISRNNNYYRWKKIEMDLALTEAKLCIYNKDKLNDIVELRAIVPKSINSDISYCLAVRVNLDKREIELLRDTPH